MPQTDAGPPFRYLGGDPSLDLVNTVDWTDQGLTAEQLTDYRDLLSWSEGAGLISPGETRRLRRRAASHRIEAGRIFGEALRLRALIRSVAIGSARGAVVPADLERFNLLTRKAQSHRRLQLVGGRKTAGLHWTWDLTDPALELPLWAVTLTASNLLASPEADRIRVCQGPVCGWMYVDRSRNGLRRWCAMDMCGGREKARRHYARVKQRREN